jgi:hypothetical protein
VWLDTVVFPGATNRVKTLLQPVIRSKISVGASCVVGVERP